MKAEEVSKRLIEKGLKVTPQRIAILNAILQLNNHPAAENIIDFIRKNYPNISTATVYKVLDALYEKGLINKVKTDHDVMRYDAVLEKHHHIYCSDSERIEDYKDGELDALILAYFERKGIPNFTLEDVRLQIVGRFIKNELSQ
jgi:Fur family transcriptional regulator, peroxide stress response regulator